MDRNSAVAATAIGAAGALLIGTMAVAASSDPNVIQNPTQQQALDANTTIQNYIQQHGQAPEPVATSPAVIPPPLVNPTVAPTPSNDGAAPANVSGVASDSQIVLTWAKPATGTPTGYIYGRGGSDSTGYGAYTSAVLPASTTSQTLLRLVNGQTYTVFVEAVYPAGNKRVSLTLTPNGTSAPVTATPGPSSPTPIVTASPVVQAPSTDRPSALTWNSGVWNDQQPTQTAAFVANVRGGRNVDNVLVYTSRATQASQYNPVAWKSALPANFNGINQDLVLAVTTWTGDGAYMTAAQGKNIGIGMCAVDSMHPIARIDWEMNLQDGAGSNGAVLTSSNYTAWVARFRAVATAIKSGCPSALIDFNTNVGRDQTSGCNPGSLAQNCSRRAFAELKDVIDIYGIDTYDSYPPVTASGSGWSARTGGDNGLEEGRKFAVANGKKFSVPEWGVACNGMGCQWQGNAGADDPTFIHLMLTWFSEHAGDMAYETYFNEPASYIVSDLINNNPNSRARYRADLLALAAV